MQNKASITLHHQTCLVSAHRVQEGYHAKLNRQLFFLFFNATPSQKIVLFPVAPLFVRVDYLVKKMGMNNEIIDRGSLCQRKA